MVSKFCYTFANEIKNDGFLIQYLTFKNKEKKIMEEKNYEFKAYDSKGKEIKLKCFNVFYGITEEMAQGIRMGIEIGLAQKYKGAYVRYKEI